MLSWAELISYINYTSDFFIYGFLFILLGLILFFGVQRLRKYLVIRAQKTETKWDDILVASLGRPMMVIALFVPAYYGIVHFIITPEGSEIFKISQLPEVIAVLLVAWFLSSFVRNVMVAYGRKHIQGTTNNNEARFLGLLDLLAVYIIWFIAFLIILGIFEINLTPFIAGLGIAGIAVALAAQDMLGNFFGGAMIYADRPFKIGDRIKLDENVGDVLDVGLRSTRIKTLDNELMTIPNSTISKSIIINYALPDLKIKVRLPFCVSPTSDIDKVKQILFDVAEQASKKFEYIREEPKPEVFLLEIREYQLELMVTFWTTRFDRKWESRDYINCEVLRRFRAEGVELPVPQRKIYIRDKACECVPVGSLECGDEICSFDKTGRQN
ncbi:MAG: mechanosensitive ion channel family protein [Methanimicrococcus sp.]|nr:mechanosensitive ion channel family protein [Methanimicrococcus sp.]